MNHGTYNGYKHYGCRCRKCVKAYKEACERGKARYKAQMANPDDPRHGTITGYQYGCRCEKCKAADKAYNKAEKNYHSKKMADPNHPKHGTITGYGYGCRCDKCREANNEYNLQYRYRRNNGLL